VINYDIPANPEDYVHRIGRTGRAMAIGDAFTLTTPEQADDIRAIERFIGQKVPQLKLEGFNYNAPPPRPMGFQGAAPSHGHGQRFTPPHSHQGQRPTHDRPPVAAAPQSGPAPANRPAPTHAYQQPAQPAAQPAPRKFGGLSRGTWHRR